MIAVDSKVTSVTVFNDRAEVNRAEFRCQVMLMLLYSLLNLSNKITFSLLRFIML